MWRAGFRAGRCRPSTGPRRSGGRVPSAVARACGARCVGREIGRHDERPAEQAADAGEWPGHGERIPALHPPRPAVPDADGYDPHAGSRSEINDARLHDTTRTARAVGRHGEVAWTGVGPKHFPHRPPRRRGLVEPCTILMPVRRNHGAKRVRHPRAGSRAPRRRDCRTARSG